MEPLLPDGIVVNGI